MIMQTFEQWYMVCAHKVKNESSTKAVALGVSILLLGGAGVGYRWYAVSKAQEVQKVLGECLDEYNRALAQEVPWQDVELHFSLGYDHYGSTAMGAYFLSGKVEALLKQNKIEQALDAINTLLSSLSPSAPTYELYVIKRALIRMDIADQVMLGLEELKKSAMNEKNIYRDRALYYLGLYHWSRSDLSEAKKQWTSLVELSEKRSQGTPESPWVSLVAGRLEQIV